jgi:short-subunit dehydrogenase
MARVTVPSPPRHVAITGASSGLGAALAQHYARLGAVLSLTGRNADRLNDIGASCTASPSLDLEVLDVTDAMATRAWLLRRDALVPIDLLIANAGIGGDDANIAEDDYGETAARILATNVLGVVNTVTPMVPAFVARRRGQIAIMSSLAGYLGLPQAPAYSASKAAVRTYGDALRRLLAPHGVAVSVVCPGFVETPLTQGVTLRPMWKLERAAETIVAGLSRGSRFIAFPFSVRFGARLLSLLPISLADRLLTPRPPAREG